MTRATPILLPLLLAGCAAAPMDQGDPATRIVAFGDSYTEGYGANPDEAYPALLARELDRTVFNKGVTGETAGEALRRLDRDVIRNDPDVVIVEFGVNEAFRGLPVGEALRGIETIVERVRAETNASIVLVGVHFWDYREDFDDGLRALAAKHRTGLVLDVLDGIVSSQREADDGDPALRHDKFHPNAAGYAIMAERIRPAVESALPRASPSTT